MTQGALEAGHKICMLEASATALQGAFKIPDDQVILMDAQESWALGVAWGNLWAEIFQSDGMCSNARATHTG